MIVGLNLVQSSSVFTAMNVCPCIVQQGLSCGEIQVTSVFQGTVEGPSLVLQETVIHISDV